MRANTPSLNKQKLNSVGAKTTLEQCANYVPCLIDDMPSQVVAGAKANLLWSGSRPLRRLHHLIIAGFE